MSIAKEQWAEKQGRGHLSASQVGSALGLRGCISDFIQYEREIKYSSLAFKGNSFTSHGIRVEPIARAVYEYWTGNLVFDGGFFVHPIHAFLGCSPDGMVIGSDGDIGLLEIKSPYYSLYSPTKTGNMSNGIPKIYMCQMQCQMHITRTSYCDFFVYLYSNGDRVLWRVKRSEAWWSWALSKLQLVSRAILAENVPEAMQTRKFSFPEFNFDLIENRLIIGPEQSEPRGVLRAPIGYHFSTDTLYSLYGREALIRRVKSIDHEFRLSRQCYKQSRTVRILHMGTEKDPFFLVSDVHSGSRYRVLGKHIFPSLASPSHFESTRAPRASPYRKRFLSEKLVSTSQHQVIPLLHSIRDISEYYSMMDNRANLHIVEGTIRDCDKAFFASFLGKINDRFSSGRCTYSTFDDFRSCFQSCNESHCDATKSAYLCSLHRSLTDESVEFIFLIEESPFSIEKIAFPYDWITPTLVLSSKQDMFFANSKHPRNLIFWCDGELRHRLSIVEKYWT